MLTLLYAEEEWNTSQERMLLHARTISKFKLDEYKHPPCVIFNILLLSATPNSEVLRVFHIAGSTDENHPKLPYKTKEQ